VLRLGREWRTQASMLSEPCSDVSLTASVCAHGADAMRMWWAADIAGGCPCQDGGVAAQVAEKIDVPFHEVDAHNVVPVWEASDKRETGARTIRGKINRQLGEYLEVGCRFTPHCAWTLVSIRRQVRSRAVRGCTLRHAAASWLNIPNLRWPHPWQHAGHCLNGLLKGWITRTGVPGAAAAGQLESGHHAGAGGLGRPYSGGPGAGEGGARGHLARAGRGRRSGGNFARRNVLASVFGMGRRAAMMLALWRDGTRGQTVHNKLHMVAGGLYRCAWYTANTCSHTRAIWCSGPHAHSTAGDLVQSPSGMC
jgi:hypothetical protein